MGLFSSVLVLTLLRDLLLLAAGSPSLAATTAQLVFPAAAALTLVGFLNARRVARVVTIDIHLADLPAALAGFTIAQISDIHVGATIKRDYVRAIVDRVNHLGADLVAITGDVVDGSVQELFADTAPLADLKARHGAYIVTGNHEYYSGATEWMAEFRRLGLRGLMNEHVIVEHDGARLVMAGVTDYSAHAFDLAQRSDPGAALAGSPEGIPRILLAHQPRSAQAAALAGFMLVAATSALVNTTSITGMILTALAVLFAAQSATTALSLLWREICFEPLARNRPMPPEPPPESPPEPPHWHAAEPGDARVAAPKITETAPHP
ncbi:MAG: hypothetical protein B7Y53_01255 [Halothiobacillus sp. 28-55-5]|nr:MAG: hypothetical protein B7Y53_01255 [Halothiobacillus sp. 28-55-5]